MPMDVWVDPKFGIDGAAGTESAPHQTIQFAHNATDVGGTTHLLPGDYIDQTVTITRNDTFFFVGERGQVRIIDSSGTGSFITLTAPSTVASKVIVVNNMVLYNHFTPFESLGESFFVGPSNEFNLANISALRDSATAGSAFCYGPGTAIGNANTDLKVNILNCTVRNFETVFLGIGGVKVEVAFNRNNFYDGHTTLISSFSASYSGDYNAYDGTIETNGFDTAAIARTDIYQDLSAMPIPDLSPKRGSSPSPLFNEGEYGDFIGAPHHFIQVSQRAVGVGFVTDWTGWQNDELYWNSSSNTEGPDGPIGEADIASLVSDVWEIGSDGGGGISARVISKVYDFGIDHDLNPTIQGIDWWAEEDDTIGAGSNEVVDNTKADATRNIEYRASNVSFTSTASATGDIEWTLIEKGEQVDILRRYWQVRVTLRHDGQ